MQRRQSDDVLCQTPTPLVFRAAREQSMRSKQWYTNAGKTGNRSHNRFNTLLVNSSYDNHMIAQKPSHPGLRDQDGRSDQSSLRQLMPQTADIAGRPKTGTNQHQVSQVNIKAFLKYQNHEMTKVDLQQEMNAKAMRSTSIKC